MRAFHSNTYSPFSESERERAQEMSVAFLKLSMTLLGFRCLIYSQNFSLVEGRMTGKNNPQAFPVKNVENLCLIRLYSQYLIHVHLQA